MAKMDYEQAWKDLKRHLLDCRFEVVKADELIEPEKLAMFHNYGEVVNMMDMAENHFIEKHLDEVIKELPEDSKVDPVNHPTHYETGKFECIEVMQEAIGTEAVKDFCICNSFKYIYRHKRKNGKEDIKKVVRVRRKRG